MKIRTRLISLLLAASLLTGCASSVDSELSGSTPAVEQQTGTAPAGDGSSPAAPEENSSVTDSTDGTQLPGSADVPEESSDVQPGESHSTQPTQPENTTSSAAGNPTVSQPEDSSGGASTPASTEPVQKPAQTLPATNQVGADKLSPEGAGKEGSNSPGAFDYGEALQRASGV